MENSTKAIIIAASIVITMAIVSMAVFVFNLAKKPVDEAGQQIIDFTEDIKTANFTKFDGEKTNGANVIALIESLSNSSGDSVGVSVKTNSGSTKWYVHDASNADNLSKADRYYKEDNDPNNINPAGVFKGTVVRNDNGNIVAVTFEQQAK